MSYRNEKTFLGRWKQKQPQGFYASNKNYLQARGKEQIDRFLRLQIYQQFLNLTTRSY